MEFPEIWKLIEKWNLFIKEIQQFKNKDSRYHYNVKRAMQLYRELAAFLRTNEPVLRAWMVSYLGKYRRQIFVRWWCMHVSQWATEQIKDNFPEKKLHPDTQRVWDSMFGAEKGTQFSLAYTVIMQAKAKRELKGCDDLTILAQHEGKQCDGNGFYCDLCDTQEHAWHQELIRRVTESQHILLNPTIYYRHSAFYNESQSVIIASWSPPHIWGKKYKNRSPVDINDIDEYKEHLTTERLSKRDGQTPIQATHDFISATLSFSAGWHVSVCEQDKYIAFCGLWNTLDIIDYVINLDLPRVDEIEAML
jgi:hypothetical protein